MGTDSLEWQRMRAGPAGRVVSPEAVAHGALGALLVTGLIVALGLAGARPPLAPYNTADRPGWLGGPLADLGPGLGHLAFVALLVLMALLYVVVLARADAVRAGWGIGAVVVLNLVYTAAPPLVQTDIFGYLMYGRLAVLHDLVPYLHVANEVPGDPVRDYVGWPHFPSPYGPVFTLFSYGLAALPLAVGVWLLKAGVGAASLACVALTWSCARRLGIPALPAALFVGLNPLLLIWGVGAAHNDLMMLALMLAGLRLALTDRTGLGAAVVVGAAAVKATSGLLLPFLVVGATASGRWRAVAGAGATVLGLAGVAVAAFGLDGVGGYLATLYAQQQLVSGHSVPNDAFRVLGLDGLPKVLKPLLTLVFMGTLGFLLHRALRGVDWIASAGWATLALLMTMTFLMPWYLVWLLPLAALGRSARLRGATLVLMGFLIVARGIVLLT